MNTHVRSMSCATNGAGALGVDRPVEDGGARPHERPQVGLEVDHDEALQAVRADHLDPERPADAAPGAVGGDDVAAADLVARAARQLARPPR